MRMRTASLDDLDQILHLINSDISDNNSKETNLVILQIDKNFLKQAIGSKEVYIPILEGEDGKIIGVILAYEKSFISKVEFKKDKMIQKILKEIRYDFVYADKLVIDKTQLNKGYQKILLMSFLDDTKKKTIIKAISPTTINYITSKNLFEAFKFKLEKEISVYDDLIFGIYELDN